MSPCASEFSHELANDFVIRKFQWNGQLINVVVIYTFVSDFKLGILLNENYESVIEKNSYKNEWIFKKSKSSNI